MTSRDQFVHNIISAIGAPYIWGGSSPVTGLDCSGLVVWALGIPDTNSAGLGKMYKEVVPEMAMPGTLWLYGTPKTKINHVMVCVRVWTSGVHVLAGARGGDSTTTSERMSVRSNAFVDTVLAPMYQPIKLMRVVDPFISSGPVPI